MHEMAKCIQKDLIEDMINGPFSIATDGSNDARDKQFPIVVTTSNASGLSVQLLSIPVLQIAATGLFFFFVFFL